MKIRLSLAMLAVALGSTGVSSAVTVPIPTVIAGQVLDILGNPASACVTAYDDNHVNQFELAEYHDTTTSADGSYTLNLPAGDYRVVATDRVTFSPTGCPGHTFWSGHRFESSTKYVNSLVDTAPLDFALRWELSAGPSGTLCCYNTKSTARPGATITLYARVDTSIEPHVRVWWKDHANGADVELSVARRNSGFTFYEGTYTIPSTRPDGAYTNTFRTESALGVLTNTRTYTTFVDTQPPAITQISWPPAGETVYPDLRFKFSATDNTNGDYGPQLDQKSRIHVFDITGTPVEVTGDRTFSADGANGPLSTDPWKLTPNHNFEARFDITDMAGNTTTQIVPFWTGARTTVHLVSNGPTGTVTSPTQPIEIFANSIAVKGVYFLVSRLSAPTQQYWAQAKWDPSTRRLWIDPGGPDGGDGMVHPLLDGDYKIEAFASSYGDGVDIPNVTWTFRVALS